MRTTIRLDDELLKAAKQHALISNRTFTQLVNDALAVLLERERAASSPRTIALPTYGGDGFQSDVDINRSDFKRYEPHLTWQFLGQVTQD